MAAIQPHMPEVDVHPPDVLREKFAQARAINSKQSRFRIGRPERAIALLTPGRILAEIPCPPAGSMTPTAIRQIEAILPGNPARNVVSIAFTELSALQNSRGVIDVQGASQAIPFIGFLLGFGYIGHSVVIFEGHPSALAVGLEDADLVLADAEMIPFLQPDWVDVAYKVMRTPTINVYNRDGRVTQIVRKAKNAASAHLLQGSKFLQKGELDNAIAEFNEAIRLEPGEAHAYASRGLAYTYQGNFGKAIEDCTEAIRLKPDLFLGYVHRASARRQQGDLAGAMADCNEAIRLRNDSTQGYANRALIYEAHGEIDKAMADLETAEQFLEANAVNKALAPMVAKIRQRLESKPKS